MNIFMSRINEMKQQMESAGVDVYLVPTADYHHSEYVAPYFKEREFLSGFTGSNGTLLISKEESCLWTDGRYFIQCEHELQGSGIQMMKMGEPLTPTISEYLISHMKSGMTLGFDGRCLSLSEVRMYEEAFAEAGLSITMEVTKDLPDALWENRPALPTSKAFLLPLSFAGVSAKEKVSNLRKKLTKAGADSYTTGKLDEIMWLTNLRGNDVECNPVCLSYCIVSQTKCLLFIQKQELSEEIVEELTKEQVEILPYEEFLSYIGNHKEVIGAHVWMDPDEASFAMYHQVKELLTCEKSSPLSRAKAIRNPIEIAHTKEIYENDSAACCHFIYEMKQAMKDPSVEMTEFDAAERIDALRAEIPGFIELSFPTISAYGANAAMMHYQASKESAAILRREGMLLVDSGGQYMQGTTDVTRTIALGPVTEEMVKAYTLTAAGNLNLLNAVFLEGCTGRNIDILAREPLWQIGSDYKCGTGHGIGFVLNVHEGPQNIRPRGKGANDAAIVPGMVISNEPGVYIADSFGIRLETILLTEQRMTTADGKFYGFYPLTYVPFERGLMDPKYLSSLEIERYNAYQKAVYDKMCPFLSEEEKLWLQEETAPLSSTK